MYELLSMDDELRDAIAGNPTITSFRNLAVKRGMKNLRHDGFAKVAEGLTTVDEILRLTPGLKPGCNNEHTKTNCSDSSFAKNSHHSANSGANSRLCEFAF